MTRNLGSCLAFVGCLALAGALSWAFLARGPEVRELEGEVRLLRAELYRAQAGQTSADRDLVTGQEQLDAARREEQAAEAEVQRFLAADPRLATDVDSVLADLRSQTAKLEAGIEAAGVSPSETSSPEPPPPPPDPAPPAGASRVTPAPAERGAPALDQHLERFRAAITLVVSAKRQLATGLVVGLHADRVYLLTVADAVAAGADVVCLLRSSGKEKEEFQLIPCEVVYREEGSPFLLLEGTAAKAELTVLTEANFKDASEPDKGQPVYGVGAHAVGASAFTGSVFEGIVSSLEEGAGGGRRLLRTTLPANEGSPGSLVINADGKVAGILWQGAPELARASAVLPAVEARPVLERLRRQTLGGGDSLAEDYHHEAAIELPNLLSSEAEVFAGPDDLVLIWERTPGTLRAFRSGSVAPVWEITRGSWSALAYRPWQPYGFLTSAKAGTTVTLNLRTGKPGAQLAKNLSGCFAHAWAAFPIGKSHVLALPQGLALANVESGRLVEFRGLKATLMAHAEDLLTLSTDQGDVGWLTRGEFLTIFSRIDALKVEIENLWRDKKRSEQKRLAEARERERQIVELSGQLDRGLKLFKVPGGVGRDSTRPGMSACLVPGTYVHIIDRDVWRIGPDQVTKLGRFERLWHSGGRSAASPPCAMVSPDGRYAVTGTHLHELKDFKAVAELPFPTGATGFTSKGKTLYAHDGRFRRLVFLNLEEVLSGKKDASLSEL